MTESKPNHDENILLLSKTVHSIVSEFDEIVKAKLKNAGLPDSLLQASSYWLIRGRVVNRLFLTQYSIAYNNVAQEILKESK